MPRVKRTGSDRGATAARGRLRLILLMGGKCTRCGCDQIHKLEMHHTYGRDWEPKKLSRWSRLARYRREWTEGLIELHCRSCNARVGRPLRPEEYFQEEIPY